jgi:hypothetical protein
VCGAGAPRNDLTRWLPRVVGQKSQTPSHTISYPLFFIGKYTPMFEATTLAFYKGTEDKEDRLIQWWTKGPYSHCEIIIGGYSYSSSARDGGVRRKRIAYNLDNWDFVEVNLDQLACLQWFSVHDGEKYDYLGLIGFVVPWNAGRSDKWFCSEALAVVLDLPELPLLSPSSLFMQLFTHERFQAKFLHHVYSSAVVPLTYSPPSKESILHAHN